jgi:hypothetical protein
LGEDSHRFISISFTVRWRGNSKVFSKFKWPSDKTFPIDVVTTGGSVDEHDMLPTIKVCSVELRVLRDLEWGIWLVDGGGGHCVKGISEELT